MIKKKNNVILSPMFCGLMLVSLSSCIFANDVNLYPAEVVRCYIEKKFDSGDTLRAYSLNNVNVQNYEITFSEKGGLGYRFNVFNNKDEKCNVADAVNDYVPPREGQDGYHWKLSSQAVKKGCVPEYFEVSTIKDNEKKYDKSKMDASALPEIQLKLGSLQADGRQELSIINNSSKNIEIIGFFSKDGSKSEVVEFKEDGPVKVGGGGWFSSNQVLSVTFQPIRICKPGVANKAAKGLFDIKYKVENLEKTLTVHYLPSCEKVDTVLMEKTNRALKEEASNANALVTEFQNYATGNATLANKFKKDAEESSTLIASLKQEVADNAKSAAEFKSYAEGNSTLANGFRKDAGDKAALVDKIKKEAEGNANLAAEFKGYAEGNATLASNSQGVTKELERYRSLAKEIETYLANKHLNDEDTDETNDVNGILDNFYKPGKK